ncbi:hypothetical protein GCM10020220_034070 [Nonomuraea rubra]
MFGRFGLAAVPAPACDATEVMARTTVNATATALRRFPITGMTTPFDKRWEIGVEERR